MSEEVKTEQPPAVDVARPDIQPPEKKKRGRKPLPRDANGNIIRDPAEQRAAIEKEVKKRLPTTLEMMSDENVGKAIAGAFAAIGLFRGPHWRLFPQEASELGEIFGPLARLMGGEEFAKWIAAFTALPVVIGVLAPRIAVERAVIADPEKKPAGRIMLLQIKGMMEAEKTLNLEQQVKEAKAFQTAVVNSGVEAAVEMRAKEEKAEGVVQ